MIFSRRNVYCVYFLLIAMMAIILVSTDTSCRRGNGNHPKPVKHLRIRRQPRSLVHHPTTDQFDPIVHDLATRWYELTIRQPPTLRQLKLTDRRPKTSDRRPKTTARRPKTTARRPKTTVRRRKTTTRRPKTTARPKTTVHPQTTHRSNSTVHPPTTRRTKTTVHPPTTHRSNTTIHHPTTHRFNTTVSSPTTHRPKMTVHPPTTHRPESPVRPPTTYRPEPPVRSPTTHRSNTTVPSPTTHRPKMTVHPPTTDQPEPSVRHPTTHRPEPPVRPPTTHPPQLIPPKYTHPPVGRSTTTHRPELTVPTPPNRPPNSAPIHPPWKRSGYHSCWANPAAIQSGGSNLQILSITSTVKLTVSDNNQYGDSASGANGIPLQGQTGQPIPFPGNSVTYPCGGASGGSNFPTGIPANPNNIAAPNPGIENSGISSLTPGAQYSDSTGNPSTSHGTNYPASNNGQTGTAVATSVPMNNMANEPIPPVQEFQYFITNEELWNLTEDLFVKDEINVARYVAFDLQKSLVNENATDEASGRLLYVRDEAYALPTIRVIRDLYDNYEFDSEKKEIMDANKRRQENVMLDVFLNTDIMIAALNWLTARGYIKADDFEWKDTIRDIWMSRVNGATSAFERIFLAEKYPDSNVLGGQNWIYFDYQEYLRRVKYMGYVDKVNLGDKATVVKINFKIDDVVKLSTTMLIGTPPELEMALYTICYYARPDDFCTVSLGGTKINVYTHAFCPVSLGGTKINANTHAFRDFGKDFEDLGSTMS